jgi:hypothetical protein
VISLLELDSSLVELVERSGVRFSATLLIRFDLSIACDEVVVLLMLRVYLVLGLYVCLFTIYIRTTDLNVV